jgi:hypothetical protein
MRGTGAALAGTRRASELPGAPGPRSLRIRRDGCPCEFVGFLGVMTGRSFEIRAPCRLSSASNGRSDHALLYALHTLQVLEALLMKHIDIELFHDLNDNVQ